MSQLKLALDFLKKMGLPQKDVSSYLNIPASTLSHKKKGCSPNDPLLLRIESTFDIEYSEEKKKYFAINDKELFQKIKNYTYGKAMEYINTHWYLYFYYGNSPEDRGLGKAIVHIWEQYKVEIKNLPDDEGRIRDYFGTFELDKSGSYLVLNLFDAYTRDKYLHVKFAVGVGSKPTLAIGHYSNIGEGHKLDARNVIMVITEEAPKSMESKRLLAGTEGYLEVDRNIRRFLSDKDKNCLRIPQTIIKSHRNLNDFFKNYDIERKKVFSDKKLQHYGGESYEKAKVYYVYHLYSEYNEEEHEISIYTLKIWTEYEQGKFLAELHSYDKVHRFWRGELSRYESCLNFVFKQDPLYQDSRYAFLQASIPDKTTKKTDFMEGILTGMQHTGRQLLSFRVLILAKESENAEDNLAKVKAYFQKFSNEPNNLIKVTPTLKSEFSKFLEL